MLSRNQIKFITSLRMKKFRDEHQQFIAEGHKLVMDMINSNFRVAGIFAEHAWLSENQPAFSGSTIPVFETTVAEMARITSLSTPSPVLAVVQYAPAWQSEPDTGHGWSLALDDIRDPGNLGTIIRIADWFGIEFIFCSETCVDLYNPKVVQATMGSITRVKVYSVDLVAKVRGLVEHGGEVYGAFLEGTSIYEIQPARPGTILIGNEARGISSQLERFVTRKIFIPSYGSTDNGKAESLNASVATAVICAEFRRKESRNG